MKYFNELSASDKDRAINKLIHKPKIRYNTILRVNALVDDDTEYVNVLPASVVSLYWLGEELYCNVVFDSDQGKIVEQVLFENCLPCNVPEPAPNSLNHEDQNIARKGLLAMLTDNQNFVFDEKLNAFPV